MRRYEWMLFKYSIILYVGLEHFIYGSSVSWKDLKNP